MSAPPQQSKERGSYNATAESASAVIGVPKRQKSSLKPVRSAVAEERDGTAFLSTRELAPSFSLVAIQHNRENHRDVEEKTIDTVSIESVSSSGNEPFKKAILAVGAPGLDENTKTAIAKLPAIFLPFVLLRTGKGVPQKPIPVSVTSDADSAKKKQNLAKGVSGFSDVLMGKMHSVSNLTAPSDQSRFNEADLLVVTDMAQHLDKELRSLRAARTRRIKNSGLGGVDGLSTDKSESDMAFLDTVAAKWKSIRGTLKSAKTIPHTLPNGIKEILSSLPKASSMKPDDFRDVPISADSGIPSIANSSGSSALDAKTGDNASKGFKPDIQSLIKDPFTVSESRKGLEMILSLKGKSMASPEPIRPDPNKMDLDGKVEALPNEQGPPPPDPELEKLDAFAASFNLIPPEFIETLRKFIWSVMDANDRSGKVMTVKDLGSLYQGCAVHADKITAMIPKFSGKNAARWMNSVAPFMDIPLDKTDTSSANLFELDTYLAGAGSCAGYWTRMLISNSVQAARSKFQNELASWIQASYSNSLSALASDGIKSLTVVMDGINSLQSAIRLMGSVVKNAGEQFFWDIGDSLKRKPRPNEISNMAPKKMSREELMTELGYFSQKIRQGANREFNIDHQRMKQLIDEVGDVTQLVEYSDVPILRNCMNYLATVKQAEIQSILNRPGVSRDDWRGLVKSTWAGTIDKLAEMIQAAEEFHTERVQSTGDGSEKRIAYHASNKHQSTPSFVMKRAMTQVQKNALKPSYVTGDPKNKGDDDDPTDPPKRPNANDALVNKYDQGKKPSRLDFNAPISATAQNEDGQQGVSVSAYGGVLSFSLNSGDRNLISRILQITAQPAPEPDQQQAAPLDPLDQANDFFNGSDAAGSAHPEQPSNTAIPSDIVNNGREDIGLAGSEQFIVDTVRNLLKSIPTKDYRADLRKLNRANGLIHQVSNNEVREQLADEANKAEQRIEDASNS